MKFYLENYGCTLNRAQGEMIASSLVSQGNQMVGDRESADSVLLSTCVVIKHTEDRMLRRIGEIKKEGKDVIVSGCLTHLPLQDVKTIAFSSSYSNLPILKEDDLSVGIPIAEGCDGGCAFCISRIARGRLRSFSAERIIDSAREMVERGTKEIRLTALDTGSYGQDRSTNLPSLVKKITEIPGEFEIRIGMMEPENAHSIMDEILEVMKSRRVYKFLHVPFQSGDQSILRRMGRQYKVEEFVDAIREFRKAFPEGMLSTDVIVGFPHETVDSLRETVRVVREVKPEILNVTKYSPRPGTAAYSWKTPPTNQTAQWSQILSEVHRTISDESMRRFVGKSLEVVPIERGKSGTYIARDVNYHPVVVKKGMLGNAERVMIKGHTPYYLIAK